MPSPETTVANQVRRRRELRGMSQLALAATVQLTRQSISAIEAGRATPSVDVALRIAQALDTSVEELFSVRNDTRALSAWLAPSGAVGLVEAVANQRYALGFVRGRWVGHALSGEQLTYSADALRVWPSAPAAGDAQGAFEPLRTEAELRQNVVLMGCAAGLGALANRLNARPGPGRFVYLTRSSGAALAALEAGHVHVAGLHLVDEATGESNTADVRRALPGREICLFTLAAWEMGLVTASGNPRRIRGVNDLLRRGTTFVGREPGSGARRLLETELLRAGMSLELAARATCVGTHLEVVTAVASGFAHAGIASRDAAIAAGLDFVPLTSERFDLALPKEQLDDPRFERLLDTLTRGVFRSELKALGYDVTHSGELREAGKV